MKAPIRPGRVLLAFALLPAAARAQSLGPIAWSIEWKDVTMASPDTGGATPITESDQLAPASGSFAFGPLLTPTIGTSGGQLGLPGYTSCIGHAAGVPCGVEVDALSSGRDAYFRPGGAAAGLGTPETWFSVDEWALGLAAPAGTAPHASVDVEAPFGDSSGDVFIGVGLPTCPAPPGTSSHNVGVIDGDGLPSGSGHVYFGIGNVEPNSPSSSGTADRGDDLDALDIGFFADAPGGGIPPSGAFFSLDAAFFDVLEGHPNSGSAAAIGVSGAAVLVTTTAGVFPTIYAQPVALGLDLLGAGTDDLDALALRENGLVGFQPSKVPFDWLALPPQTTDMLLFSVRRGSAVIGRPDSIFGLPIQPGDVLTTPLPTANGGVSPFPGIFLAAENLGLFTDRSLVFQGDDLNALDSTESPCFDCNNNGVEDSADIAAGTSADANTNGVPDECEGPFLQYCECSQGEAPCGNSDPSWGCSNSTGGGGRLEVQSGSASVGLDNLVLRLSHLPPNQSGILYMGGGVNSLIFGDGLRCATSGGVGTHRFPIKNGGAMGTMTYGPGIAAHACNTFPASGCIDPGETWYFQGWYRDPNGPCGLGFNLTNGLSVQFQP